MAEYQHRWLALIGWQSGAFKCRPRDRWISWRPREQFPRVAADRQQHPPAAVGPGRSDPQSGHLRDGGQFAAPERRLAGGLRPSAVDDPDGKPVLASPPPPAVPRFRAVPRSSASPPLRFRMWWFQQSRTQTRILGQATPRVLRSFPHPSSPEAPSLTRRYPVSPVLRASPSPRRSRLLLADSRLTAHRRGFPCRHPLPLVHMPSPNSRRNRTVLASLASRPLAQPSPFSRRVRLPHYPFRSLRSILCAEVHKVHTLRPVDSLSRLTRPFGIGVLQSNSCRVGTGARTLRRRVSITALSVAAREHSSAIGHVSSRPP